MTTTDPTGELLERHRPALMRWAETRMPATARSGLLVKYNRSFGR